MGGNMEQICCFEKGTVENLTSDTKYKAIKELIRKTIMTSQIRNIKNLEKAVIEREKIQSTGIGHGIAVAHGRTDEVKKTMIVLGISRRGIDYGSFDGHPVHFLFIIANPPDKQDDYLSVLSSIVRVVSNKSFRDEILTMSCPREIERKFYKAFTLCRNRNHDLALQAV
jgi:PTS system nitrogen regulatory IIA component